MHMQLRLRLLPHRVREGDDAGTLTHMAPELFEDEPASPASDVYAFAVVMWYLATLGEEGEPWEGKAHAVEKLVLAGRRPKTEDLEIEAPRFVRLLERCWHAEAAARPGASEAAQELEAMAFDFDESDEHATRTQGNTKRLLEDVPCQLPPGIVQALEGQWRKEKLLRVHSVELAAGGGAAPAAAPSAAQQRLVDEAVRAVEESCPANRGFRRTSTWWANTAWVAATQPAAWPTRTATSR